MAVRKTETGVDLDSRRILLLRQQEEGKLNKLRYVGPTVWNGATVPIYQASVESSLRQTSRAIIWSTLYHQWYTTCLMPLLLASRSKSACFTH